MRIYSPTHGYLTAVETEEQHDGLTRIHRIRYTSDPARAHEWGSEASVDMYIRQFTSVHGPNDLEIDRS